MKDNGPQKNDFSPTSPPPRLFDRQDAETIALETEAAESLGRETHKFLLLAVAVVCCLAALHLTPLRETVTDVQHWKNALDRSGPWAPAVFFFAAAVLVAIGVPRLFFCGAGGMLFGFNEGLALSHLASVCGSYAAFVFARWSGRTWVSRKVARMERLRVLLEHHPSSLTVFLVRQFPVAGLIMNLMLAMTPVRHRPFLVGTFWGLLPAGLVVTLVGSGIGKHSLAHSLGHVAAALALLGLLAGGAWALRHRLTHRPPAAA